MLSVGYASARGEQPRLCGFYRLACARQLAKGAVGSDLLAVVHRFLWRRVREWRSPEDFCGYRVIVYVLLISFPSISRWDGNPDFFSAFHPEHNLTPILPPTFHHREPFGTTSRWMALAMVPWMFL